MLAQRHSDGGLARFRWLSGGSPPALDTVNQPLNSFASLAAIQLSAGA